MMERRRKGKKWVGQIERETDNEKNKQNRKTKSEWKIIGEIDGMMERNEKRVRGKEGI